MNPTNQTQSPSNNEKPATSAEPPKDMKEKPLTFNLNAKSFIPKATPPVYPMPMNPMSTPFTPMGYMASRPMYAPGFNPGYPHHHYQPMTKLNVANATSKPPTTQTPLNLPKNPTPLNPNALAFSLNSKPFIPKSLKKKDEKKKKIVDKYFLVDDVDEKEEKKEEPKKKIVFDYDYMMGFEKWKISKESSLLTEALNNHLADFHVYEIENIKLAGNKKGTYKNQTGFKGKDFKDRGRRDGRGQDEGTPFSKRSSGGKFQTVSALPSSIISMEQWGRKDFSKEYALAEKNKESFDEIGKRDPIKYELTDLLNQLTVDNYEEKKEKIFNVIESSVDYQCKFLDVLFAKAVNEKAFVHLYAKLCKELDKMLPQKIVKPESKKETGKKSKPTSEMRSKLLDRCRTIFKIENNEKFETLIRGDDEEEKDMKKKKFILGNVNFIGELINIQVLSKKIVFQCIQNLFQRYKNDEADDKLKLINLEAIVIMVDNFGSLIKKKENSLKPEDKALFESQIENFIEKLNYIQENEKLPGHIKYKIINLIERKKEGWVETKFQKSTVAKSQEQVKKEYEESLRNPGPLREQGDERLTQDEITDKIRSDLINFRDYLEEEGKTEKYDWSVVDEIYTKRKNTMKEIITAYVEDCIDLVQKPKDLKYTNLYLKEVISYYNLTEEEIRQIVEQVMDLFRNIYYICLDNLKMIDVWGNILYFLFTYEYLQPKDFEVLTNLDKEHVETILQIFAKVGNYDSSLMRVILKIPLVKENKVLFKSYMEKDKDNESKK